MNGIKIESKSTSVSALLWQCWNVLSIVCTLIAFRRKLTATSILSRCRFLQVAVCRVLFIFRFISPVTFRYFSFYDDSTLFAKWNRQSCNIQYRIQPSIKRPTFLIAIFDSFVHIKALLFMVRNIKGCHTFKVYPTRFG